MPLPTEPTSQPLRLPTWAQLALVLLPALIAYILLGTLATPVPFIDDYQHIFSFALNFQHALTPSAKLAVLFTTQVGPYKLVLVHSLVALQLLSGGLNFPVLIVLGNLTPLGIFIILWKNNTSSRRNILLLLPVSLLLFSLNYAETLDWAISGLQQPAVIFFSFAAVHFLVKCEASTSDLLLAILSGILASATYANGMIVWPVGLLFLLLGERNVKRTVLWSAAFLLTLVLYLYHYQPDPTTTHSSIAAKAVFFAMFCGGAFENMHHRPVPFISLAIGLAALAAFVHAVGTRYDRRSPFFFYSTLWLLLTAAVVSNARIGMGMQLSLSSRYKIYCDLLLIFCYKYLLDRALPAASTRLSRRWLTAAFTAALIVFLAGDAAGARFLITRRDRANTAMRAYLAAPQTASPMFVVEDVLSPAELLEEERARIELTEAIRLGIYTPPHP